MLSMYVCFSITSFSSSFLLDIDPLRYFVNSELTLLKRPSISFSFLWLVALRSISKVLVSIIFSWRRCTFIKTSCPMLCFALHLSPRRTWHRMGTNVTSRNNNNENTWSCMVITRKQYSYSIGIFSISAYENYIYTYIYIFCVWYNRIFPCIVKQACLQCI